MIRDIICLFLNSKGFYFILHFKRICYI